MAGDALQSSLSNLVLRMLPFLARHASRACRGSGRAQASQGCRLSSRHFDEYAARRGRVQAIRSVSFEVRRGEALALIGFVMPLVVK